MSCERVANRDDLWVGEMACVRVDRMPVVLVNVGGVICAYEDRCPHRGVPLSRGHLASGSDGDTIICGAHGWSYDARSGRGLNPRGVALHPLPVRVEGEEIFVTITNGDRSETGGQQVGPVLQAGPLSEAVVAAICATNRGAEVLDRGAYLRVLVPGACVVARAAIEAELGAPFRFPADLERVMPSFKGRLTITDDEARWES